MATETRTIPAEKPEMQLGDSGILVVIAQELLKDGGEYTGVCDGIFREDLALAIKTYEKSAGLNETGAIYPDTLPLLAKRFLESLEGEIPSGECTIFIFQDSGLHVDALRECKYTSNGDGTHKVEPVIIGFDFNNWKEEQAEIYFPAEAEFKQNAYNSPCHPDGDKSVCMDCGADMGAWLTQQVELNLDALLEALDKYGDGIGINLNILPDELTDYDLPPVSGMSYSLYWNALQWDTFEGALRYDVYLWSIGKDGPDELLIEDCVDDTGGDTNSFGFPMLNGGQYLAALLAKDDSGAVSDHTFLYFGVGDGAMPEPLEVELKDGCASWAYEYGNLNPLFHVDLIRTYVIDHGLNHESVYEADTENAYMDLTEVYAELAVKGTIEPGDSLFVGVMAMDADGNLEDSAMVHSEFVPWTAPNFYRVLCAVNVRRGPGKSFERIGGYSLGDYFVSFGTETGEDGTYYVVNYKGQTGYVLSSCAAWFIPKLFTSHVDMGGGKSAEVFTNLDGTIDQTDLANKVQKLGWRLTGLRQTAGSGTGELDLTKVLSPGDTFEAIWEKDPDYVFVRFCKNGRGESAKVYDPEGKLTDKDVRTVLFGVSSTGLNCNVSGSVQARVIELIGAKNAIQVGEEEVNGRDGGNPIDFETLYNADPDVVILAQGGPYDKLTDESSQWKELRAVKGGNYYEIPGRPYSWMSAPPSVNQVLGARWLMSVVYPDLYDGDIYEDAKEYYKLFWHYDLSDEEVREMLQNSAGKL